MHWFLINDDTFVYFEILLDCDSVGASAFIRNLRKRSSLAGDLFLARLSLYVVVSIDKLRLL